METALSKRKSWKLLPSRIREWFGPIITRLLGVGIPIYVQGSGGTPARSTYSVDRSMSAMAANPWVFTCVQAISTDLSGLPLVAIKGNAPNERQLNEHWLIELLKRPSTKVSGKRFRKQLIADLKQSGNCYIRVYRRSPSERPYMLGRIPPQAIEPIVAGDGEEVGWKLTRTGAELPWHAVLHVSDVSWEASVSAVLGESPIRPLALGLQVDTDSRKHAGRAAKRGRLDMVLSPKDPEIQLGEKQVRGLVDEYGLAMESGEGVYVANMGIDAQPVSITARDGEFLGISDRTKNEILAVFGVPPVRAGDPAANYGTAKQQMKTYWETLRGLAELIDDELSRLAEPGVRIAHSFERVEALQTSYTERQNRAVVWTEKFGVSPAQAARYEGFIDAPIPANVEAPQEDTQGASDRVPNAANDDDSFEADEPRERHANLRKILTKLSYNKAGKDFKRLQATAHVKFALESRGANKDVAYNLAYDFSSVYVETLELFPDDPIEASYLLSDRSLDVLIRQATIREVA